MRRTRIDWAHCVKNLIDVHHLEAEVIVLMQDNLNTHTPASLYQVSAVRADRVESRHELYPAA